MLMIRQEDIEEVKNLGDELDIVGFLSDLYNWQHEESCSCEEAVFIDTVFDTLCENME